MTLLPRVNAVTFPDHRPASLLLPADLTGLARLATYLLI